jgi:hypothetical protein
MAMNPRRLSLLLTATVLSSLLLSGCAALTPRQAVAPESPQASQGPQENKSPTDSAAPRGDTGATTALQAAPTAGPAGAPKAAAPAGAPAAAASSSDRAVGAAAPAQVQRAEAARQSAPNAAPTAPASAPVPPGIQPPPPAPTPGPGQAANLPPVTLADRMIIYTTELTLNVKSVEQALNEVGNIAAINGGYIASVENSVDNGLPLSTIRIKVLPDRYQAAMQALRSLLGQTIEVRGEKATTQDVTEEYSDVQTQIASLEATHKQLLEIMARANSMDEVLKIQQQAAQIKLQIDRLRGRATALERLSSLATITVRLQPAEAVLARDFVTVRSQLRQSELQQVQLQNALERAKTDEEANQIRDKLAELAVQIERSKARLDELTKKAEQAGVALPAAVAAEPVGASPRAELPQRYIDTRVQIRRAEARQAEVTRLLREPLPADQRAALQKELSEKIVELGNLQTQLRSIQERAQQLGVVLPNLTPEQEAALAGTAVVSDQPDVARAILRAWEASLTFLRGAIAATLGALVFLWWALPLFALAGYVALRRRERIRAATVEPSRSEA